MLPEQVLVAIREKLTETPAWVAFGIRTEALLTPSTPIVDESAGKHHLRLEVDADGSLVYTRSFADGSSYQLITDVRAWQQLPAVAVGLEWTAGSASLRLAAGPDGLPKAPALRARLLPDV